MGYRADTESADYQAGYDDGVKVAEAKLKIAVDCLKELHKRSFTMGQLATIAKQALEKVGE